MTQEGADRLVAQRFFDAGKDIDDFTTIKEPSNWEVLGFEEHIYGGFKDDKASEGLYIRQFTVPRGFASKRLLPSFGSV